MNGGKRYGGTATVIGNTIYIMGGQDSNYYYLSSSIMFHTSTNTWSSIPDMNEMRCGCQAVTMGSNYSCHGWLE